MRSPSPTVTIGSPGSAITAQACASVSIRGPVLAGAGGGDGGGTGGSGGSASDVAVGEVGIGGDGAGACGATGLAGGAWRDTHAHAVVPIETRNAIAATLRPHNVTARP